METLKMKNGSYDLELGLYDSANGKTVLAHKAIDVTNFCKETDTKRVVVKYANVERGLIGQLTNWYKRDKDMGTSVHYFLNETSPEGLAKDCVFEIRCRVLNVDPLALAKLIFENSIEI